MTKLKKADRRVNRSFLVFCFGAISNRGHESQDVLGCNGGQLYVAEMVLKVAKDEFIVAQGIFFSRSSAGN